MVRSESLRSAMRRHLSDRSEITDFCRLSTTSGRGSHQPNVICHADGTAQFIQYQPPSVLASERGIEQNFHEGNLSVTPCIDACCIQTRGLMQQCPRFRGRAQSENFFFQCWQGSTVFCGEECDMQHFLRRLITLGSHHSSKLFVLPIQPSNLSSRN